MQDEKMLDYFIVGVQKAGTTALNSYLERSPHVQTAKIKEIHFFDDDSNDWSDPDYSKLTRHFDWTPDSPACRGEATPIYLYWPEAMQRLQRYNTRAKIVVCLRHPAYRAHSQWRMELKRNLESSTFEYAISDAGRRDVREAHNGAHRVFSYVERGFYAKQISKLTSLFPPQQLLFLRTDSLWENPPLEVARVHEFLGIAPPDAIEPNYIVPIDTRSIAPITRAALGFLSELFADDILETQKLTHLRLDDWSSPDYSEPMPAPFASGMTCDRNFRPIKNIDLI